MSDGSRNRKSRQTLKNYFRAGALPEERHFHDLVDSTLNMEDEGFNKTPEDGLHVCTRAGASGDAGQSLVSFFREGQEARGALWRMRFDRGFDALQFVQPSRTDDAPAEAGEGGASEGGAPEIPPLLTLAPGGRIGVNRARPEADLDVGGAVRSRERQGVVPDGIDAAEVRADGEWHPITGTLEGLQALEVVAGVGGVPGSGQYALVHATCLNAYQPRRWFQNLFRRKNPIRAQHAWHRSRADRLQLRWRGDRDGYRLEIRTGRAYGSPGGGGPPRIIFHITRLWDHPTGRVETPPHDEPAAGSTGDGPGGEGG